MQKNARDARYRHQSLGVIDSNQNVVGRLSQVNIMHALEPRYSELSNRAGSAGRC